MKLKLTRDGLKKIIGTAGSDAGRAMKLIEQRQHEMQDGQSFESAEIVRCLKKGAGQWDRAAKFLNLEVCQPAVWGESVI